MHLTATVFKGQKRAAADFSKRGKCFSLPPEKYLGKLNFEAGLENKNRKKEKKECCVFNWDGKANTNSIGTILLIYRQRTSVLFPCDFSPTAISIK